MATDYAKLAADLERFYNFSGKVVLYIGAGTRQLLDPATPTKKLVAIDKDETVLRELKAKIAAEHWEDRIALLAADFLELELRGDVVYFEFCLHEMDNPAKALVHAKALAPDLVVYDHSAGSEWSYYAAEEDKVAHSSATIERFGIRRRQTFQAEQRFANLSELIAKVGPQGPRALARAQRFTGATDIVIPMSYELNLL